MKLQNEKNINFINIVPGKEPLIEEFSSAINVQIYINRVILHSEFLPYPRQYGRNNLKVVVDMEGLLFSTPYNRWGLTNTFFIISGSKEKIFSLATEQIEEILGDLKDVSGGYLHAESGITNPLRSMFVRFGIPNSGYTPEKWF